MSVITTIVILQPHVDRKIMKRVNEWIAEREFHPLTDMSEKVPVGQHGKVPDPVWVGGYNYFPDEEFMRFVQSLHWEGGCSVSLTQENGTLLTHAVQSEFR